jgi:hypothetical protein
VLDAYANSETCTRRSTSGSATRNIDEHYNSLFRELLTYMIEDPRTISSCAHLLFIAKNLERIGDHGTNIAEYIHFLVTGEEITTQRPRADAAGIRWSTPQWPRQRAMKPRADRRGRSGPGRTLLQYNLEKEGYRVVQAANDGEEALILVAEEEAARSGGAGLDAAEGAGIEVCRRLRRGRRAAICRS